ncbi:hypothetical protein OOU_Y34scaffold00707g80 [Pyricularia oryzae Y34]|uniref:IBR domain-containing protein n=1 Tax=Pyricularia oryzae (strain Y34) TaxID=1143189 RepID=A0AA97NSF3_PYRO3|nr:hypothetical protein OOU_Y34scaffold00707g80 [Pyricularia oryzae Y34]
MAYCPCTIGRRTSQDKDRRAATAWHLGAQWKPFVSGISIIFHSPPEHMTAGASTALRGGRVALERVKKGPGAKDCPRCGSAIEKTEGCTTTHDMACPGCKCHICWKCLDTSDTSKLCYNHLTVRHGWWVLLTVDARLLQ